MEIPKLEFSQGEIMQLLVSQPIQITPERPLQTTILRNWDLIKQLLSTRQWHFFCNQFLSLSNELHNLRAEIILRLDQLLISLLLEFKALKDKSLGENEFQLSQRVLQILLNRICAKTQSISQLLLLLLVQRKHTSLERLFLGIDFFNFLHLDHDVTLTLI